MPQDNVVNRESGASQTIQAPARRDAALDGLRGIAILLVFLFHYGGGLRAKDPIVHALGYLTQMGWVGVQIFFVLSGFLITGTLWDSLGAPDALRNFYARRILRIVPLYLLALVISFVGAVYSGGLRMHGTLPSYLIYLFFLQDVPGLAGIAQSYHSPYALYHLWSLAVEEQFYLLWPFALLLVDTRRSARTLCLRLFWGSAIFRIAIAIWLPSVTRDVQIRNYILTQVVTQTQNFVLSHVGALAMGGAIALALRSRDRATGRVASPVRFLRRYAKYGLMGGLLLFFAAGASAHSWLPTTMPMYIFGLPAISVASASLITMTLRRGGLHNFLATPLLAWLGRISYGFYIFHILLQPWFDAIARHTVHTDTGMAYQLVRMAAAFPLTVIVAALSWRFVERPFLRIAQRFPLEPAVPDGLQLFSPRLPGDAPQPVHQHGMAPTRRRHGSR